MHRLHCWVQFVSYELTVVNCTTWAFQFLCLPSDWEVHREHSVLFDLQLPVQDHPRPAVSMHQVSLRPTVARPDDPSAGACHPAGEVWERKRFFSRAVKRKSVLDAVFSGTEGYICVGSISTCKLAINKCLLQHRHNPRWNEGHCDLIVRRHEKIAQHPAGTTETLVLHLKMSEIKQLHD